jgi:hypothetical protein
MVKCTLTKSINIGLFGKFMKARLFLKRVVEKRTLFQPKIFDYEKPTFGNEFSSLRISHRRLHVGNPISLTEHPTLAIEDTTLFWLGFRNSGAAS